jgi:hypothetical protein
MISAGTTRLELAISGVTGQRGLQLPYVPRSAAPGGIEPLRIVVDSDVSPPGDFGTKRNGQVSLYHLVALMTVQPVSELVTTEDERRCRCHRCW